MQSLPLPPELLTFIHPEKPDFAVKAKRAYTRKSALTFTLFGIMWMAFSILILLGPADTKGTRIQSSGVSIGADFLQEPILILFILIGLAIFLLGLHALFKKGGYFVGTPTRLIAFDKGRIESFTWEKFSGTIQLNGSEQEGDIMLEMTTGKMVKKKNGDKRYRPDILEMVSIPHVFEIEKICRHRIGENLTPASNHSAQGLGAE